MDDVLNVLQFAGVMTVIMGTVFGSYAMVVLIRRWEQRGSQGATRNELAAVNARLERLEQAVDTIAIEVERVAEGQRFASKLLAERLTTSDGRVLSPEASLPRPR